jgi:hypothetical protein
LSPNRSEFFVVSRHLKKGKKKEKEKREKRKKEEVQE